MTQIVAVFELGFALVEMVNDASRWSRSPGSKIGLEKLDADIVITWSVQN